MDSKSDIFDSIVRQKITAAESSELPKATEEALWAKVRQRQQRKRMKIMHIGSIAAVLIGLLGLLTPFLCTDLEQQTPELIVQTPAIHIDRAVTQASMHVAQPSFHKKIGQTLPANRITKPIDKTQISNLPNQPDLKRIFAASPKAEEDAINNEFQSTDRPIHHSTFNIQHSTLSIHHSSLSIQPSTFNKVPDLAMLPTEINPVSYPKTDITIQTAPRQHNTTTVLVLPVLPSEYRAKQPGWTDVWQSLKHTANRSKIDWQPTETSTATLITK